MGLTGDLAGPGLFLAAPVPAAPPAAERRALAILPFRSNRFNSTSPFFSGTASSTWTCTSRPPFHVGIAGRESSFTTARVLSNVANCGRSGAWPPGGPYVGIALERYCWLTGRVSMEGRGATAWAWA